MLFVFLSFLSIVICINADMDVLIIGDWGGQELSPYTTTEETATAKIMNDVANTISPSMIWALGDNFYLKGVEDVNDIRFQDTFENVFDGESIKTLPFYVVAGNHDHYGNVSAEVAYTNKSSRWIFPNYWYSQKWDVPNTKYSLQLVMIDTVLLCGNVMDIEYCAMENIPNEECVLSPLGPENKKIANEQWNWIEKELNSSTASYLIVAGHYPVWSVAEHGPTECLIDELRPLLINNNVTMYINGHDHTFEYIVENEYPDLGYSVIGGAHECNPSIKHANDIPVDSLKFHDCNNGGFSRLHIDDKGLYLQYHFGNDSNVYFTTPTYQARS